MLLQSSCVSASFFVLMGTRELLPLTTYLCHQKGGICDAHLDLVRTYMERFPGNRGLCIADND